MTNGIQCPHCGSRSITESVRTDTHVRTKGFGCIKSLIGALILGPVGFLCGLCGMNRVKSSVTSTSTVNRCNDCGTQF